MFWKRKKDKKADLPFTLEYEEDQRSYYRVAPKAGEPLFLQTQGKRYAILDVSAGGLAFEGAGFAPGDSLAGLLIIPTKGQPIPIVLTILNALPQRGMIACQFKKIKDEDRERVHQYVLRRQKEDLEKQRQKKSKEQPPDD
ncbi:hypothetical protein AAU61_17925 [Desulfocarbo indianensis]|nr:hypothetical protein AAU61_17925 [Desulfocarbo indianensis]